MSVSDDLFALSGSMGGWISQADEELIFLSARDLMNIEHGTESFEPPTTESNTIPSYTIPEPEEVLGTSYAFLSSCDTIPLANGSGYVDGERWHEIDQPFDNFNPIWAMGKSAKTTRSQEIAMVEFPDRSKCFCPTNLCRGSQSSSQDNDMRNAKEIVGSLPDEPRKHDHLCGDVDCRQPSFANVRSSATGTKDAIDTVFNLDSPTIDSNSVWESIFSVKSRGAWTAIEKLRKMCKSFLLPTLLGSLPIVSARTDAKVDQYPSSWPPVDLLQTSIDYAWNLTAPAVPILIVIGGGVGILWTVTRKPKPRSIPALLAVVAPVIGLVYCTLQPTGPKEVMLGWIVGSLWVTVWLNFMCRAYLALVQPQAYCWLSFIVGDILYMALTKTEWINEEMSKGGKLSMGALCITAASALLPNVLAHRRASLLPK